MEDRGDPIMYTCYKCSINFKSKKCPKCGEKGTPIYEEQTYERPKNNPTDIDAFFKHKRSTNYDISSKSQIKNYKLKTAFEKRSVANDI